MTTELITTLALGVVTTIVMLVVPTFRLLVFSAFAHPRETTIIYRDRTGKVQARHVPAHSKDADKESPNDNS